MAITSEQYKSLMSGGNNIDTSERDKRRQRKVNGYGTQNQSNPSPVPQISLPNMLNQIAEKERAFQPVPIPAKKPSQPAALKPNIDTRSMEYAQKQEQSAQKTGDTAVQNAIAGAANLQGMIPGAKAQEEVRAASDTKNPALQKGLLDAAQKKTVADKTVVDTKKAEYDVAVKRAEQFAAQMDEVAKKYGATADENGSLVFQTKEGLEAYKVASENYQWAIEHMGAAYTAYGDAAKQYGGTVSDYNTFRGNYEKAADPNGYRFEYQSGKVSAQEAQKEASSAAEQLEADKEELAQLESELENSNRIISATSNKIWALTPRQEREAHEQTLALEEQKKQEIEDRISELKQKIASGEIAAANLADRANTFSILESADNAEAFRPQYEKGLTPFELQKRYSSAKAAVSSRTQSLEKWAAEGREQVLNGTMTEDEFSREYARRKAAVDAQNQKGNVDLSKLESDLASSWYLYFNDIEKRKDFPRKSTPSNKTKDAFLAYFSGIGIANLQGDFSTELKVFSYIYNTEGEEAAEIYLDAVSPNLAQKSGAAIADTWDTPVAREVFALGHGVVKGFSGIAQLFSEEALQDNGLDYAMNEMLASADAEDRNFAKWMMEAADSAGNMAPGMAAGAINPVVGLVVFGASAAGSAYGEYKDAGVDTNDAALGGVLRGLSEVFTQKLLGGLKLPGFSGIFTGKLSEKLGSKVGSAVGKAAIEYGVDVLSEVVEENAQNYIEAAINLGIGASDKYEAPGWDEFIDTTMSTMLMTGIMNAPSAVGSENRIKTNIDAEKNVITPWINEVLDSGESFGYSNQVALAEELRERINGGEVIDAQEFQAQVFEAVAKDSKKYGVEARIATPQEQAAWRADKIEVDNPDSTVIRSVGTQEYINTGCFDLKTAQAAGEFLDGIANGKITSENLSNKQADALQLVTNAGAQAVSKSLGIDVQKAATKSEARALAKSVAARYEQNAAEAKRAAEDAQRKANMRNVLAGPMQQTQRTVIPPAPAKNEVATQEITTQRVIPTKAEAVAMENKLAAQREKTAAERKPTVIPPKAAAVSESFNAPVVAKPEAKPATVIPYKYFKQRYESDKEFRLRYMDTTSNALSKENQATKAYDKYVASQRSALDGTALSRSGFETQYRAANDTKKHKATAEEVNSAYQKYSATTQQNIDNAEDKRYNSSKKNDANGGERNGTGQESELGREVGTGLQTGRLGQGNNQNASERGKDGKGDLRVLPVVRLTSNALETLKSRGVDFVEVGDISANRAAFCDALDVARNEDTANGWCVTPKTIEDLEDAGAKCYMEPNGSFGFAIAKNGDLEAVFKNPKIAKELGQRRVLESLIPQAIAMGSTKLDCYGIGLVRMYARYGFTPVARVEFNENYANPGWTASKGRPYIYAMMHNGDSAETVVQKSGKYTDITEDKLRALPLYDKESYDDAMQYRDELLEKQQREKASGLVRNEYSNAVPEQDAEGIDALGRLLDKRFVMGDLGNTNGRWHKSGDIEIDVAPEHRNAKSVFLFAASHEIGHEVQERIGEKAWGVFEESAIKVKGEKSVSEKQRSHSEYKAVANARADVACDFIGELLSDKETLDLFLQSIKDGKQSENVTGIRAFVSAAKSFFGKITGKADASTAALVAKVQEVFGTDIATAQKAVAELQKAVAAAVRENKNAAKDGDAKSSKKPTPIPSKAQVLAQQAERQSSKTINVESAGIDVVKYSKKETYAKQVDEVRRNTFSPDNHVYMGTTPEKLVSILSLPKAPMLITSGHVYTMAVSEQQAKAESRFSKKHHYHNLGWDIVKKLPDAINKPVMIIKANTDMNDASFVVVTNLSDNKGDNVVAAIKPAGIGNYFNVEFSDNHFLSGYGKENLRNYIAKAKTERRILYVDKNNRHKQNTLGGLSSNNILSADYSSSLSRFKDIVKERFAGTIYENSGLDTKSSKKDGSGNTPSSTGDRLVDLARQRMQPKVEEYGALKKGENPYRDIAVPQSVSEGTKVHESARTFLESPNTPDSLVPTIAEEIALGGLSYRPQKNSSIIREAKQWVGKYTDALSAYDAWLHNYFDKGHSSAGAVARGWLIYNNLATASSMATNAAEQKMLTERAITLMQDLSAMNGSNGRALEVVKALKQMAPDAQFYALSRAVNTLEDKINERHRHERLIQRAESLEREAEKAKNKVDALSEKDGVNDKALEKARQKAEKAEGKAEEAAERAEAFRIKIDKGLAARWMQALRNGDKELASDLEEVLFQQIAAQVPKTVRDYLDAWRYLAMLGNMKTWKRNALGNIFFTPLVVLKDKLGAVVEAITPEKYLPKNQRTKYGGALRATKRGRDLLAFAAEDMKDVDVQHLIGSNKYDDANVNDRLADAIRNEHRKLGFKNKDGIVGVNLRNADYKIDLRNLVNDMDGKNAFVKGFKGVTTATLRGWQDLTTYMMEKMPFMGDQFYKGIHYRRAFAGMAMARGYTVEDFQSGKVSQEELFQIRTYATNQALKATFNDVNAISDLFKKHCNENGKHRRTAIVVNTAVSGTMPFRGVPANIFVRAFEYSPLGLIKAATADIAILKDGKLSVPEYIERIASGLSGTAALCVGALLSSLGVIRLSADDDDKLQGKQNYSLEIFDYSVSLDWLAPTTIPVFMGAELYDICTSEYDGFSLKYVFDTFGNLLNPILDMSMMDGARSLLENVSYALDRESGISAGDVVASFFIDPMFSYLGQFVPTLSSQLASATEEDRTSTYVGDFSNAADRQFIRNVAKITEKIPGVDWRQIEYIDNWGRKDGNGNGWTRFYNSFLNTSNINEIVTTDADIEFEMLEDLTGESVYPRKRKSTITLPDGFKENGDPKSKEMRLTGEQYEAYQAEYGKRYAVFASELMASGYYDTLSPMEKVAAFEDIEGLADELGKKAALGKDYAMLPGDDDRRLVEFCESGVNPIEAYGLHILSEQLDNDSNLDSDMKNAMLIDKINGYSSWESEQKAAAYRYSLDMDAPSIGDVTPTSEQKKHYQRIYSNLAAETFADVAASESYRNADEETKAAMLTDARSLVHFYAKRDYATEYGLSDDNYDPATDTNKYDTLMKEGLTFEQAYIIKQKFNEISEDKKYEQPAKADGYIGMDKTAQETDFKVWVDTQKDFDAAQKAAVKDTYKFYRMQAVETENYDRLTSKYKLSPEKASSVSKALSGKKSDIDKYTAINKTAGLSEKDKWNVILSLKEKDDTAIGKIKTIKAAGVPVKTYISYLTDRPKNKNGDYTRWTKGKLRSWLNEQIRAGRISRAQANALWTATDSKWRSF